jgi:hypothetical protein
MSCDKTGPKFCDNNYIDAVLWGGNIYRITSNEWMASYDESNKTMGEFEHKSKTDFPNGK